MQTTFDRVVVTIEAVIKQQQPSLSDNMATAFAVLAMADFRRSIQTIEDCHEELSDKIH